MVKYLISILIFLFTAQWSFSQEMPLELIWEKGKQYVKKKGKTVKHQGNKIIGNERFTSISIQVNKEQIFQGSYLVAGKDTLKLSKDEHAPENAELMSSNLISFNGPISEVFFYSNEIEGKILFHFINSGFIDVKTDEENLRSREECLTEPQSISQPTWRTGLTPPDYNRSFSNVRHLIIHHSAGSNTSTNYTQVVRDIYIYHTEVNGWSDIGYNYLIAQDGTIYKGRDPESGSQDDVRGAHFCGMNTGTMGVCLLGNYTNIAPTDEAIQSLFSLLSWKLDKEGLNAYESFPFNSISELNAVSGHRDGCSTECPGTKTYEQIATFKNEINKQVEDCYPDKLIANFEPSMEELFVGESVNFIDLSQGVPLTWDWRLEGASTEILTQQNPIGVQYLSEGEFDVQLIVRNGSRMDTAIAEKLIKVLMEKEFDEPMAFPNPIRSGEVLSIQLDSEKVDSIILTDVSGNVLNSYRPEVNEFLINLTPVNSGIYFIRFFFLEKVIKTERIAVFR